MGHLLRVAVWSMIIQVVTPLQYFVRPQHAAVAQVNRPLSTQPYRVGVLITDEVVDVQAMTSTIDVPDNDVHLQVPLEQQDNLMELYGVNTTIERRPARDCNQQVLVLGMHQSGTSVVARLLTLLGIWAGQEHDIHLGDYNKLKWWEYRGVYELNDFVSGQHTNPMYPTWLGLGFSPELLGDYERWQFQAEARQLLYKLQDHCPVLIKDPRMCFMGSLWMEVMDEPICVITYKHPAKVVLRLSQHSSKSAGLGAQGWLHVWEHFMTSALRTCSNRKVVLVQSALAKPKMLRHFFDTVIPQLHAANLTRVQAPTEGDLQTHFHAYYGDHRVAQGANASALAACEFVGVHPALVQRNDTGVMEHVLAKGGWPKNCSVTPTDSARALVLAYEKALLQQYSPYTRMPLRQVAISVLKFQQEFLLKMAQEREQLSVKNNNISRTITGLAAAERRSAVGKKDGRLTSGQKHPGERPLHVARYAA